MTTEALRADRPALAVGHTAGTFDMFHIGHLNLLRQARAHCDRLIVGVSSDELVEATKNKRPVVPFEERLDVVSAIRYVDEVVVQTTMDKLVAYDVLRFDRLFVGDDYRGSPMWQRFEDELTPRGVEIFYFPYTIHTSSTLLRQRLLDLPVTG